MDIFASSLLACSNNFYYEVAVVSEIYCQNLKDKTSDLSLRQIVKMPSVNVKYERYLGYILFSALTTN